MSCSFSNYIRTFRRRSGLSQDELGFLLGGVEGTCVLRHEGFQRTPSLETALLYSAIFQVDPREIFAGLYEDALHLAQSQAQILLASTEGLPIKDRSRAERKIEFLEGLSSNPEPHLVPWAEQ